MSVERTADPVLLDALAAQILERGLTDSLRPELYGGLCQRIVDELEGERNRWRMVELYHVGNPIHSFETAIQAQALAEIDRIVVHGSDEQLRVAARFLGELLVHGVLLPQDVGETIETLTTGAENNNEGHALALVAFLSPIFHAPDAIRLLESLVAIDGLEHILQEDSISLKIRYVIMNALDKATNPKPNDMFGTVPRSEIYGLDVEEDQDDFDTPSPPDVPERFSFPPKITLQCHEKARAFFSYRQLPTAEEFFSALESKYRHVFVMSLVSSALSSSDHSDAMLVASLFSREPVRKLCWPADSFVQGFEHEVFMLEDTSLDIPPAFNLVAIMLHSCGLTRDRVEDLAYRISPRENRARDRFLHEYSALELAEDSARFKDRTSFRVSREFNPDEDRTSTDGRWSELQSTSSDVGYAY
ncbi:uncharacterized protein FIBRA_01211 [Fibroporia radiculosa]|uniref:MI domain-containing protein n=1 Tax=Fibroporia radiculosa TaxID=599839 RepID=J4I8D0_9APHY|nr:uncharacterized protein FIBRA_01211 [Fibroporia radiculosa]CCL99196.1 predicted protein [Fibroporia radiculosa]